MLSCLSHGLFGFTKANFPRLNPVKGFPTIIFDFGSQVCRIISINMPDYTFHTLSPIDFENLVRDLLQSELSIRLESFKSGRDDGIDLRYASGEDGTLIVQAKHFLTSGFSSLLSHLINKEKPKVDRLNPDKYLLATSVPLSPANKDKIKDALAPHIGHAHDIYGQNDLNNLLGQFPNVEKQHFKLWLSSTSLLEEILHSRIINQSRITLENIRDKARIYVVNESFKAAAEILNKYNYVIIAGIPGIGKTILADMLVLHSICQGYDFIEVSSDINEAYTVPEHNNPRVYLYDDFLGRTSLAEKLQKNEDNRLVSFISAIRKSKSAKLILTTREYILRQAQLTYEVLNNPVFEKPQYIIDLSQYTRPIRAQILYNHLYFSSIPGEHVEQIVRQASYLKIIDHPNYNPRIIEYMTDPMWIDIKQPYKYPLAFLQNLQNPFLIWEQAFKNHLSDVAREVLLVLGSLPREVFLEDLVHNVKFFISNRGRRVSDRDLDCALSELQGNFITLKRDRENDIVAFHNPSIHDFIEDYFAKNPSLYDDLIRSATFFEQLQWVCRHLAGKCIVKDIAEVLTNRFRALLRAIPCNLINISSGRLEPTYKRREFLSIGRRVGFIASLTKKPEFGILNNMLYEAIRDISYQIDRHNLSNNDLLYLVKEIVDLDYIDKKLKDDLLSAAKNSFYENANWIYDVSYTLDFFKLCPRMYNSDEDQSRLINIITEIVNSLNDDDPEFLSDELYKLEKIEKEQAISLFGQIETLRGKLAIAEENAERGEDIDYDDSYRGSSGKTQTISNEALADMFSTLIK